MAGEPFVIAAAFEITAQRETIVGAALVAGAILVFCTGRMLESPAVYHEIGITFAPPPQIGRVDLKNVAHIMAAAMDIQKSMQPVLRRIRPAVTRMETALHPPVCPVLLDIEVIGHAPFVPVVAVIEQADPHSFGKRHRKIALVGIMLKRKILGSPLNRTTCNGPEEIRSRHIYTGIPASVPIDAQDQALVRDSPTAICNIEIMEFAGSGDLAQSTLLAGFKSDIAYETAGFIDPVTKCRDILGGLLARKCET